MAVTAIVVNYNAGDLLGDCVQSLVDNHVTDIRVVDNASTDRSFDRLAGRYSGTAGIQLLANPVNRGFGPAVNDQLGTVRNAYLLVINPDCRLEEGALRALSTALDNTPRAGLAGPRVVNSRGKLEAAACRTFPTPRRAFMSATGLSVFARRFPALAGIPNPEAETLDAVTDVEATSGACMLIRTDAFRDLGGFDEDYRLHCEDLDLMYRLRAAGWRILYVPLARAVHVKGVSSASRPLWVHRQKHRGLSRFFRLHLARNSGWLSRVLFQLGLWTHWLLLWPLQWAKRS